MLQLMQAYLKLYKNFEFVQVKVKYVRGLRGFVDVLDVDTDELWDVESPSKTDQRNS